MTSFEEYDPYKSTQAGADMMANRISDDMKATVTAFSTDRKRAIVVLLVEEDEPLSFDEICDEFKIPASEQEEREIFRDALGDLQDGGLVERVETDSRYSVKYQHTEKVFKLMNGLFNAMSPEHDASDPDNNSA